MSAQSDHADALHRLAHLSTLAEQIAPAFRDKFDFSESKDFAKWADIVFQAAAALVTKQEALMAEAVKKFEDAKMAEVKAQELAKLEKEREVAHV